MSLESQVAALVTASNTLTNEVTAKQAAIDASVAAAVAAVPNLSATIYVDAVAGVDTNAGDANNPVKTIDEALTRANRPNTHIILMSGQTHTINTDQVVSNINLTIHSYGTAVTKPILTHSQYTDATQTPNRQRTHGFVLDNSSVRFFNIKLQTAVNSSVFSPDWGFTGLILLSGLTGGTIQIESCEVLIQDFKLYGQPDGRAPTSFNIFQSTIDRISPQGLTQALCEFNPFSTGAIAEGSNTLLSGLTWLDLVTGIDKDVNGALRNITTSIPSL